MSISMPNFSNAFKVSGLVSDDAITKSGSSKMAFSRLTFIADATIWASSAWSSKQKLVQPTSSSSASSKYKLLVMDGAKLMIRFGVAEKPDTVQYTSKYTSN